MKTLIFLLLLASCSTNKHPAQTITFAESSGKVEITIEDGEWEKIKSTGSAALTQKNEVFIEQSMNIATLRAKANIVEFIKNSVDSSKSVETITNHLIEEGLNISESSEVATSVSEKILSESSGILKGVQVIDRKISNDGKYVLVTIIVDRKVIEAIKSL